MIFLTKDMDNDDEMTTIFANLANKIEEREDFYIRGADIERLGIAEPVSKEGN